MKTKEEILKKHIPSQFDWLKKTDPKLIDNILKAMEEYANQQLQLGGVSKQHELLIFFLNYLNKNLNLRVSEMWVDDFISSGVSKSLSDEKPDWCTEDKHIPGCHCDNIC